MAADRDVANALYRTSFRAFVYAAYAALHPGSPLVPNWHIVAVCYEIERMVMAEGSNRLIVNLPPRSLKSFILSVCLPAWLLGRNPGEYIVCVSYSRDLADRFSRECRSLMQTAFYRRLFPRTRLSRSKAAESEFETTMSGYRISTSVDSTLTGRGGAVMIIDDPMKGDDAKSQLALQGVDEWFRSTAVTRLNPGKSLIILTMQRLHENDLSGILIRKGWPCLAIPAIAQEAANFLVGRNVVHYRRAGEPLQPNLVTIEDLEAKKREIGSGLWEAQYQQDPLPAQGNLIKSEWLSPRYDFDPRQRNFRHIILTCDPAGKARAHNDYTAIGIFGFDTKQIHLLHMARGHWSILDSYRRIEMLASDWKVERAIIEDTASGIGLIQMFRENSNLLVKGLRPDADKQTRMERHVARFEAGNFFLPKSAPWLHDCELELLAFPNGRHDDQVDAVLLFLEWFAKWNRYEPHTSTECGLPITG